VKHRNHPEWLFIWSINGEAVGCSLESQWLGREIAPLVALVREWNEFA
jgi:hypothetical protein